MIDLACDPNFFSKPLKEKEPRETSDEGASEHYPLNRPLKYHVVHQDCKSKETIHSETVSVPNNSINNSMCYELHHDFLFRRTSPDQRHLSIIQSSKFHPYAVTQQHDSRRPLLEGWRREDLHYTNTKSECSVYAPPGKTNYLAFKTQQSSHTQAEHMQQSEKQITTPMQGNAFSNSQNSFPSALPPSSPVLSFSGAFVKIQPAPVAHG